MTDERRGHHLGHLRARSAHGSHAAPIRAQLAAADLPTFSQADGPAVVVLAQTSSQVTLESTLTCCEPASTGTLDLLAPAALSAMAAYGIGALS